jgi:uncharacterized membrane protein YeaQ/YmgE (transglycosylase-associated protein family)
MDILIRIIVGGVIGWLASIVMKTNQQMGILANIAVGIVGSWLGFWLAGVLGVSTTTTVANLLVSIVGAIVLIGILKALKILR